MKNEFCKGNNSSLSNFWFRYNINTQNCLQIHLRIAKIILRRKAGLNGQVNIFKRLINETWDY